MDEGRLALTALLVLVAVRTPRGSWEGPRSNVAITVAVAAAVGATFVLVNVPALQRPFAFTALAPLAQAGIVGLVVLCVASIDVLKWLLARPIALARLPMLSRLRG